MSVHLEMPPQINRLIRVMPGFVLDIPVFLLVALEDVDARHKAGDDGLGSRLNP